MELVLILIGLILLVLGVVGVLWACYFVIRCVLFLMALLYVIFQETILFIDLSFAFVRGALVESLWLAGRFVYGCAGLVGGVFRMDVARERLSAVDAAWRMDVGLAPPGPLPDWCLSPGERMAGPGDSGARAAAPDALRREDASAGTGKSNAGAKAAQHFSYGGSAVAGALWLVIFGAPAIVFRRGMEDSQREASDTTEGSLPPTGPVPVAGQEGGGPELGAVVASQPGGPIRIPDGEVVEGTLGYRLRRVPGGTYTVGCTAGQGSDCGDDEKPSRTVTLTRGVLVGETEVTQALYQKLTVSNPSYFTACGTSCPVEQVSWYDVVQLANKLSAAEDLEPCYDISGTSVTWPKGLACLGYRLPTEAEWEVAARGGGDAKYAGGNEPGAVGWFEGNSGSTTHPVGQKQANGYGLYDMSGNVWEWVWDWYDSSASAAGAATDPMGPASGFRRVSRGGSWSGVPQIARVAYRGSSTPGGRSCDLGVRLVRTAP
jgi:formylglycine-generating enzyme required for sulfatase activity